MFWRKTRSFDDFQAEVESHLSLEADELRGMEASCDSEARARRAFGNITATQERWYEHHHNMFLDHLGRDLRQGFRQIRRRPGFSLFAILTLALGIGANSAIFGVVNAVLLRPLPYPNPGRLAMLFSGDPARELHEGRVSLLNFADWKARNRSFEDITAYVGQTFLLRRGDAPERMRSARVSATFWPLLGVTPLLGRVFTAAEERRGDRVVVLSYELWQQAFGGSKEALGQSLLMDDRTYLVIGVMPPSFRFPFADTKVWEPVTAHPYWAHDRKSLRSDTTWLVLGRLRPGVTWPGVQKEMDEIAHNLRLQYSAIEMPARIPVVPLDIQTTGKFRLSLWLLLGAVSLILLIACINVAGLLLARGAAREREFAIRRALGAGRIRIAGQVLAETLVLSACGGLLGLLLAWLGCGAVQAFGPQEIPRLAEARVDWLVILFTAGSSFLSAIGASLWPAFETSKPRIASRQWTSASTRFAGDLLVILQFALALILIVSATLLIRSFLRLRAVELGFQADHLLTMRIDLHVGKTDDQQAAYFEEAIRRAEAVPGVRSAAAISGFLRTDPEDSVQIEGRPPQYPGPCEDSIAGPFFETAGVPLKRGRVFSDRDSRGAPRVAVINETMARGYWPNDDPIGKRFRFRESSPWITVVGVTGDMRRQGIDHQPAPQAFLPHRQNTDDMMDVIVRTRMEPAVLANIVRSEIQAADKTVARFRIATVTQELREQTGERRFDTFLLGGFALAALFLSSIGVYALLHQVVIERTGEIGVRMTLGATPRSVMTLVLRQGLTLALVGGAVGSVGAWFVSRLVSKLLFETAPTDPAAFSLSLVLLMLVAGIACWMPSRRAARIDPILALRLD
ncbi:MAG TPA: ABC transporter permease [Bryobacteraceae bacterium]|nr:ABC transporter permease [Bryobacteraceae bacterium]